MTNSLEDVAVMAVESAGRTGASRAECIIAESASVATTVRLGEVEDFVRSNSRVCSLWVERHGRWASAYTSDFTRDGLSELAGWAVELTAISEDPADAELSEPGSSIDDGSVLKLYYSETLAGSEREGVQRATAVECAALVSDPRITGSRGATYAAGEGSRILANSLGLLRSYQFSTCSLGITVLAEDGESRERDGWHSLARRPTALETSESIGAIAAAHALRRLNPRRAPSGRFPVLFDTNAARGILDYLTQCVNGIAIVRGTSYLAGKLGQRVASPLLTVINDATIPEILGSYPFDDEGIPGQRTVVIRDGILENYLLNSYAARRLSLTSTASAARGTGGKAFITQGNFYALPGPQVESELIRKAGTGLYVTELLGHGFNAQSGDLSCGAAGFWIDAGEVQFPVAKMTIASNLNDMLMNIQGMACELDFRAPTVSPAILTSEMMIFGG